MEGYRKWQIWGWVNPATGRSRDAQIQGCTDPGMYRSRDAQIQGCTDPGMHRSRHAQIQGYTDPGMHTEQIQRYGQLTDSDSRYLDRSWKCTNISQSNYLMQALNLTKICEGEQVCLRCDARMVIDLLCFDHHVFGGRPIYVTTSTCRQSSRAELSLYHHKNQVGMQHFYSYHMCVTF